MPEDASYVRGPKPRFHWQDVLEFQRRRQGQDRRQDREANPARWVGWHGCWGCHGSDLPSLHPGRWTIGGWGWGSDRSPPERDVQLGPQGSWGDARGQRGGPDRGRGG